MKTKNIFLPLTMLLAVLFTSCAKPPIFESKRAEPNITTNSSNKIATNSDAKKDIDFGISNDDTDLYLQFRFQNQEDLTKIMRGGLNVYFDPEGKKNKKYSLCIEREARNRPVQNALTTQELIDMAMNNQMPDNIGQGPGEFNAKMAESICKDLEKVTWKKEDKEYIFYRNATQEKIIVELESENPSELILTVKMPLSEISVNPDEILAVGIETGTPEGLGGARPAGAPQGSGMSGGGGGGGMGGGRGGMGGGGMQGGGSGAPMGAGQSTVQPFRFWFLAQL